ncbi:MAG: glycine cleavage system protein GcvH [Planctomycetaceae bacterium]|nr:glycine cleavage system protein GcvH [Planctomycetaceae bacterium]
MDPSTAKYTKSHEWVALDGDEATIGISDFAVKQLTDLVYIELPSVGKSFSAGEEFGVVESVKAASDLYAPISGEVTAANDDLEEDLAVLSDDPYGKGWMIKLKITDPSELDNLMDRAAYEAHCQSESH